MSAFLRMVISITLLAPAGPRTRVPPGATGKAAHDIH
jgi:hypothetical protein